MVEARGPQPGCREESARRVRKICLGLRGRDFDSGGVDGGQASVFPPIDLSPLHTFGVFSPLSKASLCLLGFA